MQILGTMGVNHQVFNLISTDGTVLKGRYWKPNSFPIATICLVHGIGEHAARYDSWARRFCAEGIMVYALDYRGHGASEGKKGVINSIAELNDDINALVRRCKRSWSEIPNFIYGHSMGGALVLNYLIKRRNDFEGAIITSPWLELVHPPSEFKIKVLKWLDLIRPSLTFSTGIKSDQMTSESVKKQDADNDPLMHSRISVRLFNQVNTRAQEVLTNKLNIKVPILLAHGLADPITQPMTTKKWAEKHAPQTQFVGYENALHELHNEPVADELFNDILQFIKDHLGDPKPKNY